MESIDGSSWDVLISGTGIQESLLVLALSKSNKKILHIDRNSYYGGSEAALSLQDAEEWSKASSTPGFTDITISQPDVPASSSDNDPQARLGFSRAYSLALAPHIIYTQSALLPALVSSRCDAQLEFLAVGSWFVYSKDTSSLTRVPSSREDLFGDDSIDARSKRSLMKFLRFIGDYENQESTWTEHKDTPFHQFLSTQFKLPAEVQAPFAALTLSPYSPNKTSTAYALPRIARHLRSMGLFGPGFSAVVPKWGGLAEVAQVGCRGGAVGGAVYMLGTDIDESVTNGISSESEVASSEYKLSNGNVVKTQWTIGHDPATSHTRSSISSVATSRSISIISSPLRALFPPLGEGSPPPAVAVVVFPSSSLAVEGHSADEELPPVNLFIHSSETGECPAGQCIIYASTTASSPLGPPLLSAALSSLLSSLPSPPPQSADSDSLPPSSIPSLKILWQLHYTQHCAPASASASSSSFSSSGDKNIVFPPPSPDLVFDDGILDRVKDAWERIVGEAGRGEGFLRFPAREDGDGEGD